MFKDQAYYYYNLRNVNTTVAKYSSFYILGANTCSVTVIPRMRGKNSASAY